MKHFAGIGLLLCCPASLYAQTAPSAPAVPASLTDFFETKVRPILAEHCFACHGPKKQQAGLRLDSRLAALKGSEEGRVLEPGHPEKRSLIKAVRTEGAITMP